ncbi:Gp138 family membrane-puncturing spike protein [Neisseria polysaccharea]|uniref:Gp138 family membrane-puncturing spike protein n=1 Tax=Neisseria polysaccharea TaxID=489 RepID=UPI0027DEC480|nr:Gp138 family membrane-puncturing spike protein [Neisseria polysaccharea]
MSQNRLGFEQPGQRGGQGEIGYIVESILSRLQTVTLVKVVAVKGGGLSPVGMVDVQPLVSQIDGSGGVIPHGIIYNVPYFRLQGGGNAVIIDPEPGDIGMCGFCSRDISSVKQNKAPSAPQSRRRFDYSDGLYFGGFLNGTPKQYIHFKDGGIRLFSPGDIEMEAANIRLKAQGGVSSTSQTFQANTQAEAQFTGGGGIAADGDVRAGDVSLMHHVHKGVQPGGGNTGQPV